MGKRCGALVRITSTNEGPENGANGKRSNSPLVVQGYKSAKRSA